VRATTRRRLVAGSALLACVGGVALIVGSGGGSSAGRRGEGPQTSASTTAAGSQAEFPAGWRAHRGPVPILEYHAIQPPVASSAYPELFVPQADFEAQMSWLSDHDYEAVTLIQVEDAWDGNGKLPPKPVVVSFDDGYLSQYVGALPIMQKLNWPGVLNLKAANSDLPDADAQKMIDDGWELASHTINHLDLTTLDTAQLQHEVGDSRRILERRFGVDVPNFCYPAGHYDQAAIAALKSAGYRGATTEIPGLSDRANPYTLARLEIELSDGLDGFVQKLRGAAPQPPAPAVG
jgi:peptidoglycan/xylan/chitin deacetylase (PgdA/CDA1 family)